MIFIPGRSAFFELEQRWPVNSHVFPQVNTNKVVDTTLVDCCASWLMNRLAVVQAYIYTLDLLVYRSLTAGRYQRPGRLVGSPEEENHHETIL